MKHKKISRYSATHPPMINGHKSTQVMGGPKQDAKNAAKRTRAYHPNVKYRIIELYHGYYGLFTINDAYSHYPKKRKR